MKLLSVNEAAEQLGVSHMTVRRLIENGSLRASKIGGQIRLRRRPREPSRSTVRGGRQSPACPRAGIIRG